MALDSTHHQAHLSATCREQWEWTACTRCSCAPSKPQADLETFVASLQCTSDAHVEAVPGDQCRDCQQDPVTCMEAIEGAAHCHPAKVQPAARGGDADFTLFGVMI